MTKTSQFGFPWIDVEPTFDDIVRDYGGAIVLKDKLPKSPDFQNADYVFHFEKVVAELKCLMDDNIGSPETQARIQAKIDQHLPGSQIKIDRLNDETWKKMPKRLQNDIYTVSTASIQARVKKANRQIRETKARLGLESYSGMLIIANDGLVSLPPAAFIHAVLKYAGPNCSEINEVVYFTANLFTNLREIPVPSLFWIGVDMQNGKTVEETFVNRLGGSWRRIVCRRTGLSGFVSELQDIEGFWKAKHFQHITI